MGSIKYRSDNTPPLLGVAMELYDDTYIEKFGRNATVASGAEEVIEDSSLAIQTQSSTADIDTISSSHASDSQTLEVHGLDTNWNVVVQTKALNGQAKVTLDTALIRVYRVKNISASALQGDAYVYVDSAITTGVPDDSTKIRAKVLVGKNQTAMAKYTIPLGYTGYLIKWYASILRATGVAAVACDLDIYIKEFGGVFRSKQPVGVQNTGQGSWQHEFPFPLSIPAKSDIEVRATPTANADISAGFSILLVKD